VDLDVRNKLMITHCALPNTEGKVGIQWGSSPVIYRLEENV
jgi:hypothetical protein